jgi:glycosyltransferase involved in cell wall biosynthesis
MTSTVYRVAMFARNEERHIVNALTHVTAACPDATDLRIHVLINGCTDGTQQVVERYAATHPEVVPVVLPFGDKANAWNTYVYDLADDSPVHFFTDGDVTCSPRALTLMQETLLNTAGATAIAGMPLSGRNRLTYQRYVRQWHWLFGNLYAATTVQLSKLRSHGVRLPVGLWGNDHFISKFMAADSLPEGTYAWTQNIFRADAGFVFASLDWFRPRDMVLYWRRHSTYEVRRWQIARLDHLVLTELPSTVDGINKSILNAMERTAVPERWRLRVSAVRRLRRMYPDETRGWFTDLITRSSEGVTLMAGRPESLNG